MNYILYIVLKLIYLIYMYSFLMKNDITLFILMMIGNIIEQNSWVPKNKGVQH